jgi:hypothetical protein
MATPTQIRRRGRFGLILGTILAALMVAAVAYADNVQNDVAANPDGDKIVTVTAGGAGAEVTYSIASNNGDGQNGCNAADGTPATVTPNVPTGVTKSVSSVAFSDCTSSQGITFAAGAAVTPGDYEITASVSDGCTAACGSYNTNPAKFTLRVQAGSSDTTAPTITITTPPDEAVYLLNQVVNADYECEDEAGGSGLASCVGDVADGDPIDTSSVGAKTFTVDAEDNAGNPNSLTHDYSVIYDFDGFFRPVDNDPTCNVAKAGSAIPVKFSLSGYQGANPIASGYPKASAGTCAGAPLDAIEETATAGQSSISYDAATDQYTYVWKTDKVWAGTCRQLVVKLDDGTFHRANFKFK